MQHVDEGLLHALLDGELAALGSGREAEVRRHLAGCAACRTRLAEEREVRDRAGALLRRGGPVGVEVPPFEALAARRAPARRPRRVAALAWAASLVLALSAGWLARSALRPPGAAVEPLPRTASSPPAPAPSPAVPAAPGPAAEPVPERTPEPEPTVEPAPRARVAAREPGSAPAAAAPSAAKAQAARPSAPPPGDPLGMVVPDRPAAAAPPAPPPPPPPSPVPAVAATEAPVPGDVPGRAERAPALALAREADSARRRRASADAPESFAPEGLVVTGAGATSRDSTAPGADAWSRVAMGEARRRLGLTPLRVPGLRVESLEAGWHRGREAVRVRQALGPDSVLSLVQVRGVPETADWAAEPPVEQEGHARLLRRVGGLVVTASAPLPADSLARLLDRLR
jgi:hypothetical protein